MKQYVVVKKLLNLAQDHDHTATQHVCSGSTDVFICIPGKYGIRWVVPVNPKLGMSVLEQWQPYSFLSKLKWRLLLSLYSFEFLTKVPGINCLSAKVGTDMHEMPIIYIGTPGKQQKAVVTLVSPTTGEPQRVMKVALGSKAKCSMAKEASILNELAHYAMPSTTPVLLESAENNEWTMQSVVQGRLTCRELSKAHIDWLLALPKSIKTTTLDKQQKHIEQMVNSCQFLNIEDKQDLQLKTTSIAGGTLPLVLVHGDFAPWNLKIQADSKIAAIDWEDSQFTGLPLWDICHFFFIQGHLFNTRAPFEKLKNNSLVRVYLKGMGLQQEQLLPLVLLYVFIMILDSNRIVSIPYKEYLVQQLQLIT